MALEPEMMYVLTTVGGYLAGAATSWWVQNRGKVVDSLQDAAADAIDKIEETTGIDIPDSIEDAIDDAVEDAVDRVEDAVEDAADAAEEAIEAGDLEAAVDAVKESVEDTVEEVKAEIDVALDDLEDLTVAGLKERLVELGLPTKGRKADLIARITEYVEGSQ